MHDWPLCLNPREHLPSGAAAGQDNGMDFILRNLRHLNACVEASSPCPCRSLAWRRPRQGAARPRIARASLLVRRTGGSLLTSLIPMLSGAAGGVDIGAWVGQLVGGGVSGAIVSAIVGLILNNMRKA